VELYQPLTESMKDIDGALVQCVTTTLAELKSSNATVRPGPFFGIMWFQIICVWGIFRQLNLDNFNVENVYFRSFDAII
jgi:DNA excision repair protein ERCC-4